MILKGLEIHPLSFRHACFEKNSMATYGMTLLFDADFHHYVIYLSSASVSVILCHYIIFILIRWKPWLILSFLLDEKKWLFFFRGSKTQRSVLVQWKAWLIKNISLNEKSSLHKIENSSPSHHNNGLLRSNRKKLSKFILSALLLFYVQYFNS